MMKHTFNNLKKELREKNPDKLEELLHEKKLELIKHEMKARNWFEAKVPAMTKRIQQNSEIKMNLKNIRKTTAIIETIKNERTNKT